MEQFPISGLLKCCFSSSVVKINIIVQFLHIPFLFVAIICVYTEKFSHFMSIFQVLQVYMMFCLCEYVILSLTVYICLFIRITMLIFNVYCNLYMACVYI